MRAGYEEMYVSATKTTKAFGKLSMTNEQRLKAMGDMIRVGIDYNMSLGEMRESLGGVSRGTTGATQAMRRWQEMTFGIQKAGIGTRAYIGKEIGLKGTAFEIAGQVAAGGKAMGEDIMAKFAEKWGFDIGEKFLKGKEKGDMGWKEGVGKVEEFAYRLNKLLPEISVQTVR